ncbi:hypothetical protein KJ359_004431 [Pestalotiopsis sp. 9143b]|nr:hypothetical protein KJ359_004431 [Pestalotiopsis sp. 9143b]
MRSLQSLFQKDDEQEYERLNEHLPPLLRPSSSDESDNAVPLSWLEYAIFALLGMTMLWAWNMFLAAAPYFQDRFQADEWVLQNFQSAIVVVSTTTNLGAMGLMTYIQSGVSYPLRVNLALYVNVVMFILLTASTKVFLDALPASYLGFVLLVVVGTSLAAGLLQNGAFAITASFGRPEYMQAIMAGQGVSGVLPPIAQIVSVLLASPELPASVKPRDVDRDEGNVAFIYFSAAVVVSVLAIVGFAPLMKRYNHIAQHHTTEHTTESSSIHNAQDEPGKSVSVLVLFKKLRWAAAAIFMCFVIAMFFPVLTPKIESVTPPSEANALQRSAAFIPLAFFFWNLGDLAGRGSALSLPFRGHPALLFAFSIARVVFLPLYVLCNIHGRGAIVSSDLFYLVVVQFPYGLTNGWLASTCMMSVGYLVDESERAVAGGLMALCLMTGLTVGSVLSFSVAGV